MLIKKDRMGVIDDNILLKYMARKANREEVRLVDKWLEESESDREEFGRLKKIYYSSKEIYAINNIDEDKSWERLKLKTIDKKKNLRLRILYGAAAILVPFIFVLGFISNNTENTKYNSLFNKRLAYVEFPDGTAINLLDNKSQNIRHPQYGTIYKDSNNYLAINSGKKGKELSENITIVTPRGEQYNFILPDGSKVILNSMSQFSYSADFKGNIREVSLVGEAFLDVDKDKSRPFVVNTQCSKIKVLGTNFNVRAYPNEEYNEITLIEGRVKVNNDKGEAVLVPGKQAVCIKGKSIVVNDVDVKSFTSWTHGIFEFNSMCLQKITNSLERWYDIEFCFADKTLMDKKFTGAFKKGTSIEEILDFIGGTTNVTFTKMNNIVYVEKK